MRMRHRGHEEAEHENHERWLVSFADMMTLLMALFVVLYSMSVLNKSKFEAFQSSLSQNKATGQPELTTPAVNPTDKPQPATPADTPLLGRDGLEQLKQELEKALADAHQSSAATLEIDDKGLEVALTDGVLFNTGEAVLLPNGRSVLDTIGPKLTGIANPVTVEGHTDNQPITGGPYATNWELSTARATTVLRYAMTTYHLEPARMTASGFADTRPRAPNDTPEHRAENRRVVVVIAAPPGSPAPVAGEQPATQPGEAPATQAPATQAAGQGQAAPPAP